MCVFACRCAGRFWMRIGGVVCEKKVWQEAEEESEVRGRERKVKEAVENWSLAK